MGTQLLDLPNELLILIIACLPLRSISSCKRSCHHLRAVIKHSGLLRCRMRTMKNYLEDLSPPGLSTVDFLETLRMWEKAWLTFGVGMDAVRQATFRPFQGFSEFLLRSGYLIQMCHGDTSGWSYVDLSLQRNLQRNLRVKKSAVRWNDIRLEINLSSTGWALDIDQDLVVVSCLSLNSRKRHLDIHFLHFTTGTCHELAKVPMMQLVFEGKSNRSFGSYVEVMGNYLVVLLAHGTLFRDYQTLCLLDWTRGVLLCRRRVGGDTYFPILTSISEDTFALALKRDWALELCRIVKGGESLTFCTLCILKLPAVNPTTQVNLRCFNRTSSAPASSSVPTRRSTLPFRSSPSDSLLSFAVTEQRSVTSQESENKTYYFYALPSTLRILVEAVTARASKKVVTNDKVHSSRPKWLRRHTHRTPPSTPIVMPWDDWGPKATRWVDPGGVSVRQALSGLRCAISEDTRSGKKVRVMDFNPGRLRRVVAVRESGKNGERVLDRLAVTSPNTIKAGTCFLQDFQSSLPYYELKRTGAMGEVLMDDEWIAQIQYDGSSEIAAGHTIMLHPVVGGSM